MADWAGEGEIVSAKTPGLLWFRKDDSAQFETYQVMLGAVCIGQVLTAMQAPDGTPLWNWRSPPQEVYFNSGLPTPMSLEEALRQLVSAYAWDVAKRIAPLLEREVPSP